MEIRILGGLMKGKKLKTLRGRKTRPTSAKVRGALFDILGRSVEGTRFLDVFAGTGAIGIEALSRGAERLTVVEMARGSIKVITKNLETCGFQQQTEIIHFDASNALVMLNNRQQLFDIVFLDPPYGDPAGLETLNTIAKYPVQSPAAPVIYEHFHKNDPGQAFGKLMRTRLVRWGDTCLSFYARG